MNKFLTFAVLLTLGATASAQQKYIVLHKDNVNLRSEASTKSDVVKKGSLGAILEFVSEQPEWFQAKSAEGAGETVWVSKSVASEVDDVFTMNGPFDLAAGLVGKDFDELSVVWVIPSNGGEVQDRWTFMSKDPKFKEGAGKVRPIEAMESYMQISNTGRMNTQEAYYRGKCYPSYIVLDEGSNDYGETYEKIENPIYFYPDTELMDGDGPYMGGHQYRFFESEW